jgi:hypothetical protein
MEGIHLRCGAKCFHVETEVHGEKLIKSVRARTPAEARKTIRGKYGEETPILSARKRKKLF